MLHIAQMLSERDARRLAAEASLDVRTVKKFLAGDPVRPLVAERIRVAAKTLKLKVGG
jgi:hypothetical protein